MAKTSRKTSSTMEAKGQVRDDMQDLLKDTEALLAALGEDMDEKAKAAKKRLLETLEDSKNRYQEVDERIKEWGREGLVKTDRIVRDYPYQVIGATFGFGLLLGMLARRK